MTYDSTSYTLADAKRSAADFGDGIYVGIGKCKFQHTDHLQYAGLTSRLVSRLASDHPKLGKITRDQEIWLGEVASPRIPGKKKKATDRILDLVEWAHIYFLQLPLNDKKKQNPPDGPITVYNRWWRCDYYSPFKRRPHRDWPDLIDFLGTEYQARIVWFGKRQLVQ